MNLADRETVGRHFLDFLIGFCSMSQRQYRHSNQIKANTKAFHALLTLSQNGMPEAETFTMSSLAEALCITKQQITKLVNDLEEQDMVKRVHDSKNRRQVYIRITENGRSLIDGLKALMLSSTVKAFDCYTPEELEELDHCLLTLSRLLSRFHPTLP